MKILAQSAVLTIVLAFGMTGVAFAQPNTNSQTKNTQTLNSNSYSQSEVKSAQQKLKDDGYYNGKIDGVDGPMTRTAIRKYQQSEHLTANGRLDRETCNKLGVQQS